MVSADLLLHPVRLRIVKAFLGDRELTAKQLAAELPDVPAASIYRHVGRLAEAGVLHVVAERRVRAAIERTYGMRLADAEARPAGDDIGAALLAYAAGLLGDVDRYAASAAAEPAEDGVSARVAALWLTDDELADYLRELAAISGPRLANAPGPGRRRRMLYTVLLPAPQKEEDP
jgi:DNA-binding transcriptional ArsR family regulator